METQPVSWNGVGFRSWWLCAFTLAWGAMVCAAPLGETDDDANHQLVYHFDFDERPAGNLEPLPKYWEPIRMKGFPSFSEGGFDTAVGHDAPPSFHLQSRGRNVAYEYNGPDLAVRVASHYRVSAYLRPDRLKNARTCVSAFYRDRHGKPLLDTLVRTGYLASDDSQDEWAAVKLLLPPAPVQAATIGLAVWVLQKPMWDTSAHLAWEIQQVDVAGGVWVDDIDVVTLPTVTLGTSTPGNVLEPTDKPELTIRASDHQRRSMDALLTVWDAQDRVVMTRKLVLRLNEKPRTISVDELPVGWYHANVSVGTDGRKILERNLSFARVMGRISDRPGGTTSFGISITATHRSEPMTELALLKRQLTRSAKIPIWSSQRDRSSSPHGAREDDVLFRQLLRRGFSLTAVLADVPASLAGMNDAYPQSVVKLLADSPGLWQEKLAGIAAPYASTFRWWQVGGDGESVDAFAGDFSHATDQVRDALKPYIPFPRMTASILPATDSDTVKLPVEQVTVTMDSSVPVDRVAGVLAALRAKQYQRVSALVPWHDPARFYRMDRLADWAQRLIAARHSEADVVYSRPTWEVRSTMAGTVTEPREEFILLRTLADVIGDARSGPEVPLVGGVKCLAFYLDADQTVVALWDPSAPAGGKEYEIQLGAATHSIDLWGRSTSLYRDDHGRQRIRLTNMPVLVPGVERWLIDFRSSLSIVPNRVEPGTELVEHRVHSDYIGATAITGRASLDVPHDWRVVPRGFPISHSSGAQSEGVVRVHYSHREPAGVKEISLRVALDNDDYYLEVPLEVEINRDDFGVQAAAIMEGDTLVVEHFVQNRSDRTLNLRGSIAVPGKMRQYRPFVAIAPGATQRVQYLFHHAGALAGRRILLGLREMSDDPRTHNLALTVP